MIFTVFIIGFYLIFRIIHRVIDSSIIRLCSFLGLFFKVFPWISVYLEISSTVLHLFWKFRTFLSSSMISLPPLPTLLLLHLTIFEFRTLLIPTVYADSLMLIMLIYHGLSCCYSMHTVMIQKQHEYLIRT